MSRRQRPYACTPAACNAAEALRLLAQAIFDHALGYNGRLSRRQPPHAQLLNISLGRGAWVCPEMCPCNVHQSVHLCVHCGGL